MIGASTRNSGDVIAEVKMSMTSFSGAFLLVEGPSDSQFFRHHLEPKRCQIVICGAKDTVIGSINGVQPTNGINALGVIDDDFDRILGIAYTCGDLISTETHDLETVLLASGAWDKLIGEYADRLKVESIEARENNILRNCLLSRSIPFGQLRLINAMYSLGVSFDKEFSPWKYVNSVTWELDRLRLLSDFSDIARMSASELDERIGRLPAIPEWDLIQGHDTIAILAIGFRSGVLGKNQLSEQRILVALRLAYAREMFEASMLSRNIATWEAKSGFEILAQ